MLSSLTAIVGEANVITGEAETLKLSRDYSWYSPFLKDALAEKRADAVVKVSAEAEVEAVVGLCVREGVPLTLRGAATGNYGQCTPFQGGVLLDINGMNNILEVGDGWIEAQTGARLQSLEIAAREKGWELRNYPSTWIKSTLGGYLGGGSGGIGSVTWGGLRDNGTVKAVEMLTAEDPPKRLRLEEEAALDVLHTYGSNAIVTRATLRLAPKRSWRQIMVTCEDWFALVAYALEITADHRWHKRLASIHEWPIPSYFKGIRKHILEDAHLIFFEIEEAQADAFKAHTEARGFGVQHEIAPHEPRRAPMYSDFTYNHTTLWALKSDPSLSYLGNRFSVTDYERQMSSIKAAFPEEIWWHIEMGWDPQVQAPRMGSLSIFRYTTPERFQELRSFCESVGVESGGAHSPFLDEGIHAEHLDRKFALKDVADPHGLLNPGKLKTYRPGTHGSWSLSDNAVTAFA